MTFLSSIIAHSGGASPFAHVNKDSLYHIIAQQRGSYYDDDPRDQPDDDDGNYYPTKPQMQPRPKYTPSKKQGGGLFDSTTDATRRKIGGSLLVAGAVLTLIGMTLFFEGNLLRLGKEKVNTHTYTVFPDLFRLLHLDHIPLTSLVVSREYLHLSRDSTSRRTFHSYKFFHET
jgi:hypothetical protein